MENVDSIRIGDISVPVAIKNSKQAKRISIRISAGRDSVILTLPKRASVNSGMKFLASKADWIVSHIELDTPVPLLDGTIIPVFGKEYVIKRMDGRGVTRLSGDTLEVHCRPEFISRRVKDFLKKFMREVCFKHTVETAQKIDKTITKLTISEATSRWGSCTADGSISLNWLLIFAPPKILDYLIAHEVAHLKEMNHSVRFWKTVEFLEPDMIASRKWLKTEGYRLHRYE